VSDSEEQLEGKASVSAAINALRDELMQAFWASAFPYTVNGQQRTLRFKPAPVELTMQVAATKAAKGKAGIKWWVITAGGEASRESVSTQTVKLTLEPQMFDDEGNVVEFLVEADDVGDVASGEQQLDDDD
jgi:Trypsin-co-occurring domain 2